MHGGVRCALEMPAVGLRERVLTDSTARDDAPNADKRSFFEGDSGDRVALVPFCYIPACEACTASRPTAGLLL